MNYLKKSAISIRTVNPLNIPMPHHIMTEKRGKLRNQPRM